MNLFGIGFFMPAFIITGCEARGDSDSKYLTRFRLIEKRCTEKAKGFGLYLHIFHRSDSDDALHDHPWSFWTLILWRGYTEHLQRVDYATDETWTVQRRLWPGQIVYRPATTIHRVELHHDKQGNPKPAVTLVLRGPKSGTWGFYRNGVFTRWKQYFEEKGC